jgi:hypothetical protein
VERLFSLAGRIFSSTRRSMSPLVLEAIVFLNQNRALWGEALVAQIVNEHNRAQPDSSHDEQEESLEELLDDILWFG